MTPKPPPNDSNEDEINTKREGDLKVIPTDVRETPEFIAELNRRLKTRIPLDFTSNNSVT